MSCGSRKDKVGSTFSSKTPHFFKIILAHTIPDAKLGIPRKFVRKYGKNMSSPVLLKVPSGKVWEVELAKNENGEVWLGKGWQEFSEYYSLNHGHFLVFRYEGESQFHVLVFDTSASEIEYPFHFHTNHGIEEEEFQVPNMEEIDQTDDDSVEILEEISIPTQKRKEKTKLLQHFQPLKKVKTICNQEKFVPCVRAEGTSDQANLMKIDEKTKRSRGGLNFPEKEGRRKETLSEDEKIRALRRARTFKSKNPFFTVVMRPSYIHRPNFHVPSKFGSKYLTRKHEEIVLRVSDGRTWLVKYSVSVWGEQEKYRLCSGWKAFVQDNNLEVGDVCVFEMIKRNQISLKVAIFRDVEDANCHLPVGPPVEAADLFKSKYPFFKVVMGPVYIKHGTMTVPRSFMRNYIKFSTGSVRLEVDNKSWAVKLRCLYKFSSGWPAFVKENALRVGDVCVFEMIRRNENVLKVSIFRCIG